MRYEEVEAEIPPRTSREVDDLGATRIPKPEKIRTKYNSLLASTQTIYIRAVGNLNIETSALSGPPSRSSIGGRHHIHITIGCPSPCMDVSPGVRRKRGRFVNPKWRLSVLNVRQHISSLAESYRRLGVPCKREPRLF